jgi:hypothetical protein
MGGGEGTAEESLPAGRVTDGTDYFRLADDPPGIAVFTAGQELPRSPFADSFRVADNSPTTVFHFPQPGLWAQASLPTHHM